MAEKVYVVLCNAACDYETSTCVVCVTRSKEHALKALLDYFKDGWNEGTNLNECYMDNPESMSAQEDGDYTRNHFDVWMTEEEIE